MPNEKTDTQLSEWLSKNKYLVIFLGLMFFITWICLLLIDFDVISK